MHPSPHANHDTHSTNDVGTMNNYATIRAYYAAFNDRRVEDALTCLAPEAMLEQRPAPAFQQPGPRGYAEFLSWWLGAFPDATLTIQSISSADGCTVDVELLARGTHRGALDFAGRVFRPTNIPVNLRMRELLQVRDGLIVSASVSFDLHEIVRQLSPVDTTMLLRHLERLGSLREQLMGAHEDVARTREVLERIGGELDAARRVVRPYFR